MTVAVGVRWRLVIAQGRSRHVGSVVYGPGEIGEQLEVEARLHEAFGWTVERDGEGPAMVVRCEGPKSKRRTVSAEAYSPMDDV